MSMSSSSAVRLYIKYSVYMKNVGTVLSARIIPLIYVSLS